MKKSFVEKITKAINYFIDYSYIFYIIIFVLIVLKICNVPGNSVIDFITGISIFFVLIDCIWRVFFGEMYMLNPPPEVKEKVKLILKEKKYSGKKTGYYILVLILTALYGAAIIYTYLQEGKVWFLHVPAEKSVVYIFTTITYVITLFFAIQGTRSVWPNFGAILTGVYGYEVRDGRTYYKDDVQLPYFLEYKTELDYENKSKHEKYYIIACCMVFEDDVYSRILPNIEKFSKRYEYLKIFAPGDEGGTILGMYGKKHYSSRASSKYILTIFVSMCECAELLAREIREEDIESPISMV